MPRVSVVITIPHSQANGRHRGDGNRPSGNSRIKYVPSRPMTGTQEAASRACASGPASDDSGRTTSAYQVHAPVNDANVAASPTAISSQAMRLRGCWRMISSPTTEKAPMATSNITSPAVPVLQSLAAGGGSMISSVRSSTAAAT